MRHCSLGKMLQFVVSNSTVLFLKSQFESQGAHILLWYFAFISIKCTVKLLINDDQTVAVPGGFVARARAEQDILRSHTIVVRRSIRMVSCL
jgi:hypothetical protein